MRARGLLRRPKEKGARENISSKPLSIEGREGNKKGGEG